MSSLSQSDLRDEGAMVQEDSSSAAVADSSENIAAADISAAARETLAPSHRPDPMADDNIRPPRFSGGLSEAAKTEDDDPSDKLRDLAKQGNGSASASGMTATRGVEQFEDVDDGMSRQTRAIWHEENCPRTSEELAKKKAAGGRVEQIECDGIGPYVPPSACFGGATIEKELNELQPPNPFGTINVPEEEDNLKKTPNKKIKGRVEHIHDDDGPQLPPGMVVGNDEKYETKQSGSARAGMGGMVGTEDRDSDRKVTDTHIDSPSNQPSAAAAQDRLTTQIPPVYPQSTDSPTFYAVEATLVKETSSSSDIEARNPEPTTPIYDAVFVPEQSSLPWWKRRKVRYGGALVITAGLAAAVAVLVNNSRNRENGGGGGDPNEGSNGQDAIFYPPPPFTCAVSNLGTVYDTDCEFCTHAFAMDSEGTAALFWDQDESLGIYILSELGAIVNMSSTPHVGKDNWGPCEYVGTLALSEEVLVAGDSYYGDEYTGAVFVHEKDSTGMWNQTMQITPTNIDASAEFGHSISTDGDLIVVGAPVDREKDGSAFIYQRTETTWVQVAKLAPEDPENIMNFGQAVVVKGNIVVVADPSYGGEGKGAVFVYQYSSDLLQWGLSDIIINHSCAGKFGESLDISNGTDLVIGCPLDDGNVGAVYYYKRKDGDGIYSFRQKVTPEDEEGVADIEFGGILAADGKFMAVGTYEAMNGKVYLYTLDEDDIWKKVAKIPAPYSNLTHFGDSIALSGDNLLISYWGNSYAYKLLCPEPEPNENLFLVYP